MAGGEDNFELSNWARINDIVEKTTLGLHRMFVAYLNDIPVGVAGLSKHGELQHLFVKLEFRGNGIAKSLVKTRLEQGGWFASVDKRNVQSAAVMDMSGLVKFADYGNYHIFVRSDYVSRMKD